MGRARAAIKSKAQVPTWRFRVIVRHLSRMEVDPLQAGLDLRELFSNQGCKVIHHAFYSYWDEKEQMNKGRGFAFLDFEDEASVEIALKLNGSKDTGKVKLYQDFGLEVARKVVGNESSKLTKALSTGSEDSTTAASSQDGTLDSGSTTCSSESTPRDASPPAMAEAHCKPRWCIRIRGESMKEDIFFELNKDWVLTVKQLKDYLAGDQNLHVDMIYFVHVHENRVLQDEAKLIPGDDATAIDVTLCVPNPYGCLLLQKHSEICFSMTRK